MMHSQESGSSVFFHSQEEGAGLESWNHSRASEGSCPTKRSPEHLSVGRDPGGESDMDTGQSFLSTCWGGDAPVSLIKLLSLLSQFFCLINTCLQLQRAGGVCRRDDRSPEA